MLSNSSPVIMGFATDEAGEPLYIIPVPVLAPKGCSDVLVQIPCTNTQTGNAILCVQGLCYR